MYVLQFWPVMLFNYLFLVCLTQFFFKVKQPNDTQSERSNNVFPEIMTQLLKILQTLS